jgi:thiamine biosynthesis lipoprotein
MARSLIHRRLAAGLMLLAALLAACESKPPVTQRASRVLMGTVVDITATGTDPEILRQAIDAAYAEMTRLSAIMSHYDEASVVSAISRAAGVAPVAVPPELMAVLQMAQHLSERSHGAFDITIGALKGWRFDPQRPRAPSRAEIAAQLPLVNYRRLRLDPAAGTAFLEHRGMRLDPGGIAKLPILHAGLQVLERRGVRAALVNGGGDVEVIGRIDGRPWRVGIRDAHRPDRLYATIALERGFVISSGDYERRFERDGKRFHHILDPRTGYPVEGVRGVTLVADRLEDVNGLSAAVMVLGAEAGRRLIEATPGVTGVVFMHDGGTWVSPALAARLERAPE